MKHIKHIDDLKESRDHRDIHVLYHISPREISGTSGLPRGGVRELVPTYPMIQDAVIDMREGDLLYRVTVVANILLQHEYEEWLRSNDYPLHRYMAVMHKSTILPSDMDQERIRDLRWECDGIEIDHRVLVWDLREIARTIQEVQEGEIATIRAKFGYPNPRG